MLVLNYWTPLIYDDYRYRLETKGFATIFADEYHQWLTWTGRSVAHVMLRFLLRFNKIVFDVVSAGAFTYLLYIVSKIAQGTRKLTAGPMFALFVWTFTLLWTFSPDFAQVYFWMAGTANYSLVMVIMISYIYIYHQSVMKSEKSGREWIKAVFVLVVGILAGWCNENTSGGVLLITLGYIAIAKFIQGKHIKPWMISGVVGNILGLAVMVSAPGNAIRAAYFPHRNNLSLIWKIIDGMSTMFPSIQANGRFFLAIAFLLLGAAVWQNGLRIQEMISALFLIGGIATIVVLLIAPAGLYWSRSYFGGVFFIIVSIVTSTVGILDRESSGAKFGIAAIASYVGILTVCLFFSGVADIYQNHVSYAHQLNALIKQRDAGKKNVVVPELTYTAKTHYAMTDKNDMSANPKSYRNKQTAHYWNVKTVRSSKQVK